MDIETLEGVFLISSITFVALFVLVYLIKIFGWFVKQRTLYIVFALIVLSSLLSVSTVAMLIWM